MAYLPGEIDRNGEFGMIYRQFKIYVRVPESVIDGRNVDAKLRRIDAALADVAIPGICKTAAHNAIRGNKILAHFGVQVDVVGDD